MREFKRFGAMRDPKEGQDPEEQDDDTLTGGAEEDDTAGGEAAE